MTKISADSYTYCRSVLPRVSRTFALNIGVLDGELHRAVLCAYLFCRIVDTVEDTPGLDHTLRRRLVTAYAELFSVPLLESSALHDWIALWPGDLVPSYELDLARNAARVAETFAPLPDPVRAAIAHCVREMSLGMQQTLEIPADPRTGLHQLQSQEDLDRYCYYVAGTVGRMLTEVFCFYSPEISESDRRVMLTLDQSFARALQLTNIVKDCARDYGRGWCYLPVALMRQHGVTADHFFTTAAPSNALAVLNHVIALAAGDLKAALEFTLLIPPQRRRIRLFNLWSLFFAARTLAKAWSNPALLDPSRPVKISRSAVYRTMLGTFLSCADSDRLRAKLNDHLRNIPTVEVPSAH